MSLLRHAVRFRDYCINNKNIKSNTISKPKAQSEDSKKYDTKRMNNQSNEGIMIKYPLRHKQILRRDDGREDIYCNHQSANAILPCYLTTRTSIATSVRPIFIAEKDRFYMSCCEIL